MSQAPDQISSASVSSSGQPAASGSRGSVNVLALVLAVLIAAMLQFAAFAKLISANPRKIVPGTDWLADKVDWLSKPIVEAYFIGVLELAIVVLILAFYRWKHTWTLLAIFFISMAGFASYAAFHGRDCGCFGSVIKLPRGFTVGMDLGIAALAMLVMKLKGIQAKGFIATLIVGAIGFGGGWFYGSKSEFPQTAAFTSDLEIRPPTPRAAQTGQAAQPGQVEDASQTPDASTQAESAPAQPEYYLEVDPASVAVSPSLLEVTNAARTLIASNLLGAERENDMGVAFYIFVHDPACHVCEEYKPIVLEAMQRYADEDNPIVQVREFSVPFLQEHLRIEHWAWESTPTVIILKDGAIIYEVAGSTAIYPHDAEEKLLNGELE